MRNLLTSALLVASLTLVACGGDDDEGSLVNARRRPSAGKADDPSGGGDGARTVGGRRLRDLGLDRPACLALAPCCERVPDLLKPSCETNLDKGADAACAADLRAFSSVCGID